MNFYSQLSNVYDIVFPLDQDTVNFLSEDLKGHENVLDLACGTGDYSIALGNKVSSVLGVDLNSDMIKIAKGKNSNFHVGFMIGDMTNLNDVSDKKYNLVFCIGNSIVHLSSKDKIRELIKDIHNVLCDNGVLIIQTINFDRILKYNIDALPAIKRPDKGVSLIRNYAYDKKDETLDFVTELIISKEENEQKYVNSVPLIMLMKDECVSMFMEAGFKDIQVYGGFDKREYSDEAYAMVIKAVR